jgi:hypothetical protein
MTIQVQRIQPEAMEPIFVLGRQHSGNTMLTTLLGKVPGVLSVPSEGGFFEIQRELDALPPEERARRTARRIRDDGVRMMLRSPEVDGDMEMWNDITPVMEEAAHQGASATELYVLGMQQVLHRLRKERWVQKGTSYIFLVDDILQTFPRARLIFLARNPLDLAASTARRNQTSRHTLRLALGWNRGVKRALRLRAEQPERFLLLRYEDLVRHPELVIREACTFCGLPYDASYLDIPHVNKSDSPYNRSSERRGVTASRVFYYRDILSPSEEAAVRFAVDGKALANLYPELAETDGQTGGREQIRAMGLLASSAALLVAEEGRRLMRKPAQTITRLTNRFSVGV